uniref:Uncharacterized protein n=1 Tax=Arundo donax TaxID=35708 RepID=A0A0A9D323_ARUDO
MCLIFFGLIVEGTRFVVFRFLSFSIKLRWQLQFGLLGAMVFLQTVICSLLSCQLFCYTISVLPMFSFIGLSKQCIGVPFNLQDCKFDY